MDLAHTTPNGRSRGGRRGGRDGGAGAELLRTIFAVEVERCPRCGGQARIVGFVTGPGVIARILAHREGRGEEARAGPWAPAAAG